MAGFLHLVEAYAALAGTVGYVIWVSLDMYYLIKQRHLTAGDRELEE